MKRGSAWLGMWMIDRRLCGKTEAAVGRIGAAPISYGQQLQLTITTQGRLTSAEQFDAIVLRANPDGSVVRLRDVARVELGARSSERFSRYNGSPAAAIGIYQSPGANAVQVADRVRATMQDLSGRFPDDLAYDVFYDTTLFVKNGPCMAALGLGGEGYLSFSIATPTGEGVTTPLTFTRERRCSLIDDLHILGR